jgi:glycerol uptake facilitator-like aquaporin
MADHQQQQQQQNQPAPQPQVEGQPNGTEISSKMQAIVPFKLQNLYQLQYFVEGTAAFIFVFTIFIAEHNIGNAITSGSFQIGNLAPVAIGFTLAVLVFTFGYISGAHVNPAVTLGIFLCNMIKFEAAVGYVIAQCTGALVGCLFGVFMLGKDPKQAAPTVAIGGAETILRAMLSEGIYTFALVTVVLHVACSMQKNNHYYGFAIGMCVMCSAYAVGGFTGGAFNPAVATGLIIGKCLCGWCGPMLNLWLYWAAPAAGGAGAALLFKMVHPKIEAPKAPAEQTYY